MKPFLTLTLIYFGLFFSVHFQGLKFSFSLQPNQAQASIIYFSSYLGGNDYDEGQAIASDDAGNIYIVGTTRSADFPIDTELQTDQGNYDVFVTQITEADGGTLVFSTYLGGSFSDFAKDIAIDSHGSIYLTGYTESSDFPLQDEIQNYQGGLDAFVTKISNTGNLEFSSYLGSPGMDYGLSLAVDETSNVYVTGATNDALFPTVNPIDSFSGTAFEAFVSKISSTNALVFSTVLGGTQDEFGTSVAVDVNNNIYLTGYTNSADLPLVNQIQTDQTSTDAFIAQISLGSVYASSLDFSSYLGGNANDWGYGISVDDSGNIWVAGTTSSVNFPLYHAYQNTLSGSYDLFLTKIDSSKNFVFSTYLGGTEGDWAFDLDVDSEGRSFVTGLTESTDFPELDSLISDQLERDAYVTAFDSSGVLIFSTYLGGSSVEHGNGIKAGEHGNCYITGVTASLDFPITAWPLIDAIDMLGDSHGDAFVVKLNIGGNETCDGLDNDGDGAVDEGWPDNDGDGIVNCRDEEECNGLDDNGDGHVDEGFLDTDGDGIMDCMDEESCDGLDNDGDGLVDEGFPDNDGDEIADCADIEECDGIDNNANGITDEWCFNITIEARSHLVTAGVSTMMNLNYTIDNLSPVSQAVNVVFLVWPYGAPEGILHPTDLDYIVVAAGSSASGIANIDTEDYVDPWFLYGIVAVLYNSEDEITNTTWITYDLDWFFTFP
ncbi:MAG: hypothetical protein A3G32_06695 [Deltaproteobacteria bacterium RIFCSPLOWO2_12_FULL_40_28]|nr:MAG: hypothetical protein A3C45_02790 [Deltaproteobacteria bacterium RIFCSPHIGHO2_02_FULL_40_28]OGQ19135.1 MAG: hypothetical protein A3E27_05880 [Deltaproteobacteria bacterium RIFCSPHIGHO2_12_FULL_40_32]OGQ40307.1 MAG: hypothetical protein A3I69_01320 [Deltaproteobacteria bacterium RIFCSPLOWO2_02_FULL_40_36]OGQ53578.1 MAG: hypothetical protein A3G32_06695 [Deltaproteobacteria bacterium RIFCSPLOWO2_12_FULL_40_28]